MGFRSVFVIVSLLALVAAPAEATRGKPKTDQVKKKKKTTTDKGKSKQPKVKGDKPGEGGNGASLIASRAPAGGGQRAARPTDAVVVAKPGVRRVRNRPTTHQARTAPRTSGADQVMGAPAAAGFNASAAVTPRRRGGRIKRFVAGVLIAGVAALGVVGWQSGGAEKIGGWWNSAQSGIEQVIDGWNGGDSNPGGGETGNPGGGSSQPGGGLPGGGGEQPPEMDPTPDQDDSPAPDQDQPPQAPENPKPGGAGKPNTGGQPPETDNTNK